MRPGGVQAQVLFFRSLFSQFHLKNWSHITDTCWPLDFLLFLVFVPNLADTGIKENNTNWVLQVTELEAMLLRCVLGGYILNRICRRKPAFYSLLQAKQQILSSVEEYQCDLCPFCLFMGLKS